MAVRDTKDDRLSESPREVFDLSNEESISEIKCQKADLCLVDVHSIVIATSRYAFSLPRFLQYDFSVEMSCDRNVLPRSTSDRIDVRSRFREVRVHIRRICLKCDCSNLQMLDL
jgi:adenylate kinase